MTVLIRVCLIYKFVKLDVFFLSNVLIYERHWSCRLLSMHMIVWWCVYGQIDEEILERVVALNFDRDLLIDSLLNRVQNKVLTLS